MTNKYRIFYDCIYRGDALDFFKDIKASTNKNALNKARKFVAKIHTKRIAEGGSCKLTGISLIKTRWVRTKKETLRKIFISND